MYQASQPSAPRPFSIHDPICDGFPLGSWSRQIVEREIVSQLMGQKGAIDMQRLNATGAPLKQTGEQNQVKSDQRS
jgi:hypothetical protein